jgi:hypothetical protein
MQTVKINPNRFLRQWLISALCVWPVVGIACLTLWSPLALIFAMLGGYSEYAIVSEIASLLSLLIMPSLVIGFFVGNFQRNLLLDELFWNVEGWQRQSIIGAVFGGLLVILGSFLQIERAWFYVMPVFVFGLSSAQWFSLRHESRDAWLWILANVAGGFVFSSLMPQSIQSPNLLLFLIFWAMAAAGQGLITGVVMLYLYERPVQEEGRELAPVYLEVRNRNQR